MGKLTLARQKDAVELILRAEMAKDEFEFVFDAMAERLLSEIHGISLRYGGDIHKIGPEVTVFMYRPYDEDEEFTFPTRLLYADEAEIAAYIADRLAEIKKAEERREQQKIARMEADVREQAARLEKMKQKLEGKKTKKP